MVRPDPARALLGAPEPIDARTEPLDAVGWGTSAGALLGLAAIAWLYIASAEVRRDMATIRGEGEVARIAPTLTALGRPGSPRRDDARAARVRQAVRPRYDALLPRLVPVDPARRVALPSLPAGLDALHAWAELRLAFAQALSREQLAPEEYALTAAAAPVEMDRFLARDGR